MTRTMFFIFDSFYKENFGHVENLYMLLNTKDDELKIYFLMNKLLLTIYLI